VPNAKIIILLRNPVERAFSHFLMLKSTGLEKRELGEIISKRIAEEDNSKQEYNLMIDPGLYVDQIKRYINTFGINNVLILIFEEFIQNSTHTVKKVLNFLNIDAEPTEFIEKIHNPYGESRNRIFHYIREKHQLKKKFAKFIPEWVRKKIRDDIIIKKQKKPHISKKDSLALEDFYRKDVENLQILLKRKLPWKWVNISQ